MANFNFPTQPQKQTSGGGSFPFDLLQGDRQYYTNISFSDYNLDVGGFHFSFGGGYKLPLPKRINDVNTQLWNESSATQSAAALSQRLQQALGGASAGGIFGGGFAVNPLMFMTYQRPTYKEHEFQWILSAANKEESDYLKKMIKDFKMSAAPELVGGGFTGGVGVGYKYPKICQISFNPKEYLFPLKPCAVISVTIDYTAAGGPSFYKSGAPTVIGLTLRLKEIQLWTRADISKEQ